MNDLYQYERSELAQVRAQLLHLFFIVGIFSFLVNLLLLTGKVIDPAHLFRLGRHKGFGSDRRVVVEGIEGVDHWQVVLAAEIQIALVMGWAGKDRAMI